MEYKRERHVRRQLGFTMVELMVVLVIISILVAISLAAYGRMRENAYRAECRSNQRGVLQSAYVFSMETQMPDGQTNVNDLFVTGHIILNLCECPCSHMLDMQDYIITWADGRPIDVDCSVKGALHAWEPN